MAGNLASPTSVTMLSLWVIGAIILGIAIAYGLLRAGRLGRGERARLDRNTVHTQQEEDPKKNPSANTDP
jgi:hypothetical protein